MLIQSDRSKASPHIKSSYIDQPRVVLIMLYDVYKWLESTPKTIHIRSLETGNKHGCTSLLPSFISRWRDRPEVFLPENDTGGYFYAQGW